MKLGLLDGKGVHVWLRLELSSAQSKSLAKT